MIICDTREQKNQRILQYFEDHNIPYIEQALKTGDYMNPERTDIVVERKKDLGELLKNMCSPDKRRFWDEIRRAHDEGIRFIVLCEHGDNYKELKDLVQFLSEDMVTEIVNNIYDKVGISSIHALFPFM